MSPQPELGPRRLLPGGLFTFALILVVFLLAYGQNVWDETGTVLAGGGLLAIILLNAVLAFVLMRRPHVESLGPVSGIAGQDSFVELRFASPARVAMAAVVTPAAEKKTKPVVAVAPTSGWMPLPLLGRGSYDKLRLRLMTTAPFGLVAVSRTIDVPMEILIAPMTIPGPLPALERLTSTVDATLDDEQLGLRNYVPGDQQRLVHWRATARTGDVMVREYEGATGRQVVEILADLGPIRSLEGESAATRSRWYCEEALQLGMDVHLTSVEPGGLVRETVKTPEQVQHRLARAVPGVIPDRAGHDPVLRVAPSGDEWLQ